MRDYLQKHEMTKLFNTTKETLRHYENLGLIHPFVSEKGYREYKNDDIQKLRELLFMKDIGFSLSDIKLMTHEKVEQNVVDALLEENLQRLLREQVKIKKTIGKVNELKKLIKHQEETFGTIRLKKFDERLYLKLQYDDEAMVLNPKLFYDQFRDVILQDYYSELNYTMTYPFDRLNAGSGMHSIQCIEVNKRVDIDDPIRFPSGTYLCLFYKFNSKEWAHIELIKQKIDAYMIEHELTPVSGSVLEIERNEYAMICNDDETIYELQINVRKK